jgi:8-amino-7-oxononanoate synthase
MLDFTSSLYLGLRHASGSLRPWDQLTTGKPAALVPPPGADEIAERLAALIHCDRATLAPSTLHLFWDWFGVLGGDRVAIYMDAGVYPIGRWGVERAGSRGVPLHTFPHHDVAALRRLLRQDKDRGLRPVVVTDGFCPGCSRHAPIAAYLDSVRVYGGQLVMDDTQALGIFGHSARGDAPYGRGGGGSLQWHHIGGDDIVVIASLAKGLGVPMAVLAANHVILERFEEQSETRVHCSPPSIVAIHAAKHALHVNDQYGDELRQRLAQNVRHFRQRLMQAGLAARDGLFPVQTLKLSPDLDAIGLHQRLLERGIQTVLHRGQNGTGPLISFILTARHSLMDMDRAVNGLVSGIKLEAVRSMQWS